MTQLSYSLPVAGQPNSSEDPKVHDALQQILTVVNGGMGHDNVQADSLHFDDLAKGATGLAAGVFAAYLSASPGVVTPNAITPLTLGTEELDISSWFNVTNGRFTPQAAGYYRLSWCATSASAMAAGNYWRGGLLKNGTVAKWGATVEQAGSNSLGSPGSTVIAANGSTDYFQLAIQASAAVAPLTGATLTYMSGEMVGRT